MLNKLETILSDFNYNCIFYLRDFNADPFLGRAWGNLQEFMLRNSLVCFDYENLSSDTFTFTDYGNSYCKWLDHIVGRNHQNVLVKDIKVQYDLIGSDHLPLSATLQINNIVTPTYKLPSQPPYVPTMYIDWNKLKPDELHTIEVIASANLRYVYDTGAVQCNSVGCRDKKHLLEIESIYENIIKSVEKGSQQFVREKKKKNKFKVIPGWNRSVKDLHRTARYHYRKWIDLGRQRDTAEYVNMNNSRKAFKKA